MRYIPNLIPPGKRILPDYFKGDQSFINRDSNVVKTFSLVLAILSFLVALVYLLHPLLSLLFGLIGIILFPPSRQRMEIALAVRLTPVIRSILVSLIFISSIPLVIQYNELDRQQTILDKIEKENELQERKILEQEKIQAKQETIRFEKIEKARKDSVALLIRNVRNLIDAKKYETAERELNLASVQSLRESEYSEISKIRYELTSERAVALVSAGKYRAAIPFLNKLLDENSNESDYLYYRGLCYSQTGNIKLAVTDLQNAISSGHSKASFLHDQINPIRKRVAYYLTRCCDGSPSPSNAKGRGACSHHGGVCNWNEPVYEEYRRY